MSRGPRHERPRGDSAARLAAHDHWCQRVADRCPEGTDADALYVEIRRAIMEGRLDLAERVCRSIPRKPGDIDARSIWRVKTLDTIIYAVVSDATTTPITILTQEQFRVTRAAYKARSGIKGVYLREAIKETSHHARERVARLRRWR